jgi:hypothetical protein
MVASEGGFASVTRIWVSLSGIEPVAAASSSISFKRLESGLPTTDMKDGNGVDMTEPISTWGIFEYLVGWRGGRRLMTGAVNWEGSRQATDEAEGVEAWRTRRRIVLVISW